jgi:hypothetical protein
MLRRSGAAQREHVRCNGMSDGRRDFEDPARTRGRKVGAFVSEPRRYVERSDFEEFARTQVRDSEVPVVLRVIRRHEGLDNCGIQYLTSSSLDDDELRSALEVNHRTRIGRKLSHLSCTWPRAEQKAAFEPTPQTGIA